MDGSQRLTAIEQQILHLLAAGMQSKEIAALVGRRKPTIEGYIRVLYLKLNARSRAQLVAQGIKCGLLDLDKVC